MEPKKRSKDSGWECCYANKIFGTFGVEMRACGQKLVKFCTLTHTAKLVVEIMLNELRTTVFTSVMILGQFVCCNVITHCNK